jgi:hypothetical protein
MNDDRVFESKKAWFMLLLELGMPSIVIQKMLDISQSTVVNYCTRLDKKNPCVLSESKPILLKTYADLKCNFAKFSWGDKEFKSQLRSVLANVLEEQKIIQILESCLPIITSFTKIRYTDDIPEEYRKLIDNLFSGYYHTPPKMKNVWYDYLYAISTSEIHILSPRQFYWEKQEHFVYDIIEQHIYESREYLAPLLTKEVCSLVDDTIEKNFPDQIGVPIRTGYTLRKYYGLGCNPKTMSEIAVDMDLTPQGVSRLHVKGIRTLKRHLSKEIYPISNAWQKIQKMRQKHQQEIESLTEGFKQNLLNLDKENISENDKYPRVLFERVYEHNFSVRALNCMKSAEVYYIWELTSYPERDFMLFRNFGKESLNEIRRFLKEHNLRLGTNYTEIQVLYFQSMTKNR